MARKTVKRKRPARRPSKHRPSDRAVGLALRRFKRRAADLVLGYVAAGRLTSTLKRTVLQLKGDIDSWNDRTGLKDIRVTESKLTSDDPSWTCRYCDLIMVSRGRLCFLVGCEPTQQRCDYTCIEPPTNHEV